MIAWQNEFVLIMQENINKTKIHDNNKSNIVKAIHYTQFETLFKQVLKTHIFGELDLLVGYGLNMSWNTM